MLRFDRLQSVKVTLLYMWETDAMAWFTIQQPLSQTTILKL